MSKLFHLWKLLFLISIIFFVIAIWGGFCWYFASTSAFPSFSYYRSRGYSEMDALLFSTMSANDLAEDIGFAIIQTIVSGLIGIVLLTLGIITKKRYVKSRGEK